ncbi:type III-B CRISPR module-associated protein Cmr5 [Runella sp. SP2]|uniref:type III-B CRISPR module-associated protein Cmr5 n=1 Tax=Runella sp. SP2 TaxID=2268026 RepID=UPI000F08A772|nr:type III-B CRISPR module-associated protein Cmr5 [Runella sp. SP2]AYQ36639.1 type III-B CRISPR module-associated protein Cmr5 [Runella sp. SP2]
MAKTINGIEQGRADFAYKCANQTLLLKDFKYDNDNKTTNNASFFTVSFKKKFEKDLKDNSLNNRILEDFLLNPSKDKDKKFEGFKKRLAEHYEKYGKEYKAYVKKTPMMVKTSGLGATLAFIMSKKKDGNAWALIYNQVDNWLKTSDNHYLINNKNGELSEIIIQLESGQYRAVTNEVLALFNWLRRFAEGLIEGDDLIQE